MPSFIFINYVVYERSQKTFIMADVDPTIIAYIDTVIKAVAGRLHIQQNRSPLIATE
jgi:hypothetical protein